MEFNDLNLIKLYIVNASDAQIVWDASTYSFIFELTFPPGLIDSFGLQLSESFDTPAKFSAASAGAPELGTIVSTFCAKISFVDGLSGNSRNTYKTARKETVSADKANKEADTQRMLFEEFACRSTTAPFVPDVIAHTILTGVQFRAIFGPTFSVPPPTIPPTPPTETSPGILSSTTASPKNGVLGTPKEIYDWINAWVASDGIRIDVILMEMLDFQRRAPSLPRSEPFTQLFQLRRSNTFMHHNAALRMMAEIALVRGKRIMPHDFHEGNGMATGDGSQLYLIDWGGIFDLDIYEDLDRLLNMFKDMCERSCNTLAEASMRARNQVSPAGSDLKKRTARFPSLEELCEFFQIGFENTAATVSAAAAAAATAPAKKVAKASAAATAAATAAAATAAAAAAAAVAAADHKQNMRNLMAVFKKELTACEDFACVQPTVQNVHHALMMVAFVDFMTNRMAFAFPYCQCGEILKVVYPGQNTKVKTTTYIDVTPFDDLRIFLRTFQVGSFPSNTRLLNVVGMIEETVRLCPSACAPVPVSQLRAKSWIREEIKKARRVAQEAEARRRKEEAEAIRLAANREARRLEEEAIRLAAEAEARRLAAEAEAAATAPAKKGAKASAAAAEASRDRLRARSNGVEKSKAASKPTSIRKTKADAMALAQEAQAQEAPADFVLLMPKTSVPSVPSVPWTYSNPGSWPFWSRFKKTKGGTRKQRKQRRCFTQRRHN